MNGAIFFPKLTLQEQFDRLCAEIVDLLITIDRMKKISIVGDTAQNMIASNIDSLENQLESVYDELGKFVYDYRKAVTLAEGVYGD